jgi:tetratricopeptide (TPR) repeat protein
LAPFAPSEESPSPSESAAIVLEECRGLYDAKRHAELLLLADPHLQRAPVGPDPALAELWSLVGRSRLALSDVEGAAAAFEAAIHSAPESDQAVHRRHLAALALREGRRLLSRAERATKIATGEERIKTLRQAVRWFKRGAMTVPENEDFASAEARATKALWAAYGRTATALLQRREFQGTRRLLQEVLSQSELPRDRQGEFKELLAAAFVGEIGEIAAQAIRSVDQELKREALTLLRRAEGMLSSIPTEAMVKERLQDVNRRLWSGYTKLGLRRVEAGEFAEALEPLLHALRIDGVDPERQDETRAALVQALNHVIKERASRINQLMAGGEIETAVSEGEWLRGVVEAGRELGVREEELAAALALARPIMAQLDRARSGPPP